MARVESSYTTRPTKRVFLPPVRRRYCLILYLFYHIIGGAIIAFFPFFFFARAQCVSGANRETACTCTLPHVRLAGKIITPQLLCARRPAKEHVGGRGYGARARPSWLTFSAADRGRPEISIVNNRRARNTDTQAYGSSTYICIPGINLHYAGAIWLLLRTVVPCRCERDRGIITARKAVVWAIGVGGIDSRDGNHRRVDWYQDFNFFFHSMRTTLVYSLVFTRMYTAHMAIPFFHQ